ncbi:hypothetical protein KKD80_02445 [Patescibacteria group bacterium]|nr:hypothetical protein [Patescibacteria group bacterium]
MEDHDLMITSIRCARKTALPKRKVIAEKEQLWASGPTWVMSARMSWQSRMASDGRARAVRKAGDVTNSVVWASLLTSVPTNTVSFLNIAILLFGTARYGRCLMAQLPSGYFIIRK